MQLRGVPRRIQRILNAVYSCYVPHYAVTRYVPRRITANRYPSYRMITPP